MARMFNVKSRQRGITLIELMVVMVIVGILAAIAYPSYRSQVMRSTRTEARVALEQRALQLEKCYTRFLSYTNANCQASQDEADGLTADGHYSVVFAEGDEDDGGFILTATPQGGQLADTACATITLDAQGRRGPAGCW
jgi:type IV pilus assembly protein PilE